MKKNIDEMSNVNPPAGGSMINRWTVAVLALLVIFQAVILVSARQGTVVQKGGEFIPIPQPKPKMVQPAPVKLAFVPPGASLRKNESTTVDVFLTPKKEIRLDGADVVLSFNPQVLQITQISTPKLFSFISQKKEREKEGKIYLTFLEEKSGGLLIKEQVKLLTLTVKGKMIGTSEISVLVAEEGPSTVITESGTSRKLPFDQENFKVLVKE